MSKRRVYSADTLAIMERFYAAVDIAVQNKLVKNINVFCTENSIDRGHFYAQRKDLGRGLFQAGWLVPLVRDCGISATWLLTGKGMMFQQ